LARIEDLRYITGCVDQLVERYILRVSVVTRMRWLEQFAVTACAALTEEEIALMADIV